MQSYETTNYDMFITNDFQRDIDRPNVLRLVESFRQNGYFKGRPILVDQNLVVYDGHHRLEAAKIAQVPITYIIQTDLKPEDIVHLNEQLPWNSEDYLSFWVKNGNPNYILFYQFCDKYQISPTILFKLITTKKSICREFRKGELIFTKEIYDYLSNVFEKVLEIYRMFSDWAGHKDFISFKTINFTISLFRFLEDERIDIESFKNKIELCFPSIKKLAKVADYYKQWYDIYNYKLRNKLEPQ